MSQSTDESISLTRAINEWKADTENSELAQRVQALSVANLNLALVKAGLLAENKEGSPHYVPTDEGMSRGISLTEPNESGEVWLVYSQEARAYIKDLLSSGALDEFIDESRELAYQYVAASNRARTQRVQERQEKFSQKKWTAQERASYKSTPGIRKGKSISSILRTWKLGDNADLKAKAQAVTPMEMITRLNVAGLLKQRKGKVLVHEPTAEGEKIGISLAGPNDAGEYWPVFNNQAQEYIKRFL